ncbi:hypothetical protein YC2023_099734 [Brassica napus]
MLIEFVVAFSGESSKSLDALVKNTGKESLQWGELLHILGALPPYKRGVVDIFLVSSQYL